MKIAKLRGKIAEAGITQGFIAGKLGISENSLSAKMKEKRPFSVLEAEKLCDLLRIDDSAERADIFLR